MQDRYKLHLCHWYHWDRCLRDVWLITGRDQCHGMVVCISMFHIGAPCHTGPHGGTSMLVRKHTEIRKDLNQGVEKRKTGYSNNLDWCVWIILESFGLRGWWSGPWLSSLGWLHTGQDWHSIWVRWGVGWLACERYFFSIKSFSVLGISQAWEG